MLKNYLKTTFRSLLKHRLNTFIQVTGLALGIMACLLLLDYVGYQLSFDRFHERSDRIFRVVNDRYQDGKRVQLGTITYPTIGPAMLKDFPEVEKTGRMMYNGNALVRYGDEIDRVEGLMYVDENFTEIFSFPILARAKDTLLNEPYELVLSRELADRYFQEAEGDYKQMLGATLKLNDLDKAHTVVGVVEDFPPNSTLQFDMLGSFQTLISEYGPFVNDSWTWSNFYHFVLLRRETDVEALEAKFEGFSERYFQGQEVSGSEERFYLQPIEEAHLYSSNLEYEVGQTANGRAIWAMLILAFLILLIAWMNYVNLATVRALERAREVGVRKIAGARRSQIAMQFITEAIVVNVAGFLLAFQLTQWVRPWFAERLAVEGAEVSIFQYVGVQPWLPVFAGVLFLTGIILSGFYPAWLLSGQHMSEVLKGTFGGSKLGSVVRRGLIVVQFAASMGLVAGTLLVRNQITYLNHQDVGLNMEQVLWVNPPELSEWDSTFINKMKSLKGALTAYTSIRSAATSSRVPGQMMSRIFGMERIDVSDGHKYMANYLDVDSDYAKTYGLKPIAGRFFRQSDHNADAGQINNVLVNEAAVAMLGLSNTEEALGVRLRFAEKDWNVIGVIPDFHQRSLHFSIEPMLLLPFYGTGNPLSIRIDGGDVQGALANIQKEYEAFFPGNAFEYHFVDQYFREQYEADRRFGDVLFFFTMLAILIACMGLFALASYAALLRTREVGIRKVLGASVGQLVVLLSNDFLRLVLLATLIGLPLAWYGTSLWLREFAYRDAIAWWVFPLTAAVALILALLTVGYRAFRVAGINPANSLKTE